jgi:tetratricopeptide (TPR) repeat protein
VRALALAALVALASGGSALAGPGDGGVASPFVVGSGNRALAMGGAYVSIADDASAPSWNPAGVAQLLRGEFQGSQAKLYGLDFSEQFGAVAYPSWRWGSVGLMFRRLGVSGVEHRDADNFLLPDELTAADTEFSITWARPWRDAWHFGGSVKMQRQKVAQFSDLGLGLDLGMLVRPGIALGLQPAWTSRVQAGLAIRNAIEPTLRLDRDSVSDPAGIRAGLSYHHELPGGVGVLGALDVEKTRRRATNVHTGVEVTPHPILALRAGWGAETLSAGMGVRWRSVSVDYVLEDTDLDAVHRFGVSIGFGTNVLERRLAHQRSEEETFRARLAESFERRQREQIAELEGRARGLLLTRDYEAVLDVVGSIATLDPTNESADELETTALFEMAKLLEAEGEFSDALLLYGNVLGHEPAHREAAAGRDRCLARSDERAERTTRIGQLFTAALDAFTSGDLVSARGHLREILGLAPEDGEAQVMLARTETAIEVRVTTLLNQAARNLDSGLLAEAESALDEASGLDPEAEDLVALTARLAKAEEELNARAGGRRITVSDSPGIQAKAPTLSRKKRREIADLYHRGQEAMDAGEHDDAMRYWELVWLADPSYQNVADYLKQEYLMRGLESFSRGDLDHAISQWERALDVDPTDEKTVGYLARAREKLGRAREILGE